MAKDKTPAKKDPGAKSAAAKKRPDRRGTPKGKATLKGGPGAKSSGKGSKGRIGNPPFKATDKQRKRVEAMVAGGARQWVIAEDVGISEDTLQRHFRKELELGEEKALALIGASFMERALAGDHDAQKYVLARRAGWKTTTAVEASGPDGGPIVYTNEPPRRDLSNLTEKELEDFERLTAKLEARERAGDE